MHKKYFIQKSGSGGVTLVETLVYLSLFSFIIGSSLVVFFGILEASNAIKIRRILLEEAQFAFAKFSWVMDSASSVAFGEGPTLVVTRYGPTASPVSFTIEDSKVYMQEGILPKQSLLAGLVRVSSAVFEDIPSSLGKPEGVKMSLTVSGVSDSGRSYFENIQAVKYIRK